MADNQKDLLTTQYLQNHLVWSHQLLVNGRGEMPAKHKCPKLSTVSEDDSSLVFPFTEEEYKKGIATLKNKKAAGIDVRRKKQTTYNTDYTTTIDTNPNTIYDAKIKTNMKYIHTTIVSTYLNNRQHSKVTNTIQTHSTSLRNNTPPATRRTLAQQQMRSTTLIFKQNRQSQTPITTMPSANQNHTQQHTCSPAPT